GGMPGGVGGLWSATVRSRCRASCVRAEDRDALMFDPAPTEPPGGAPLVGRGVPAANGPAVSLPPVDLGASAAELVDQITAREDAKDAIAADQARLMVALDQRMRAERAAKGVPAARQGEGIAKQVGLARRESPNQGALLLGRAKVLVNQMPHTLKALQAGYLNERRSRSAKPTACPRSTGRRWMRSWPGPRSACRGWGTGGWRPKPNAPPTR